MIVSNCAGTELPRGIIEVEKRLVTSVPLMAWPVTCGFPSPADDYMDRPLDFNELLIVNPASTFAVRVIGDSMIDAGIFPKDIAVIDRSLTAIDRHIVLALLGGEFTIKRYRKRDGRVWLQAENPAYANILLTEESEFVNRPRNIPHTKHIQGKRQEVDNNA